MSRPAFSLAYISLVALALAMRQHHQAVFRRELPASRRLFLRSVGWLLLATSFAFSVAIQGWQLGPILWFAMLASGGFALTLLLAYAPRLCALPLLALLLPLVWSW